MTDQEINEAVARKLGWVDYEDPIVGKCLVRHRRIIIDGKDSGETLPDFQIPDYCYSIAAAKEILEHPEMVWKITQAPSGWWTVRAQEIGKGFFIEMFDKEIEMAICKAFLRLKIKPGEKIQ